MKYHQYPASNKFLPHRRQCDTPLRYHFSSEGGAHCGLNSVSPINRHIDAPRRVVYCQDASLLRNLRQSYVRRGASSSYSSPPVALSKANRFHTQLKFPRNEEVHEDDEVLSLDSTNTASSSSSSSSSSPSQNNSVRFASRVSVVEIPNRNSYTPEQKAAMWSSRRQIRKAAYRNSIEHAFEGDWRRAVEEEYFYYDENNGNWVHPAHVVYMNKNHQRAGYDQKSKPIVVRCPS